MEDERDGEDAIRGLDRIEFGRKGRRLRVEWTKQERGIRRPGASAASKRSANTRPSKTLFVINFDPYRTRTRDLERHFEPYGKIANVRIRRNFAFIQFETQEDATRALDATHLSKLMDRLISVEYAIRDDDDRGNGYSPERVRDRSPGRRGGYDRGRSPSPYRRERGSPDYGHGPSQSPYRRRGSPDYGRRSSMSPYRRDRNDSDYGRAASPIPHGRERGSPRNGRDLSPSPHRRDGRGRSPSPRKRDVRDRSPSPRRGDARALTPSPHRMDDPAIRASPPRLSDGRDLSPPHRGDGRSPSPGPYRRNGRVLSPSPHRGDDRARSQSPREEGLYQSPSPRRGGMDASDYVREVSPNMKAEMKNRRDYDDESPLPDRYRSRSPPLRERSHS